jgi:hypothetical protein
MVSDARHAAGAGVAAELHVDFAEGGVFVALAPISDPVLAAEIFTAVPYPDETHT